jgi:hypothetical protein
MRIHILRDRKVTYLNMVYDRSPHQFQGPSSSEGAPICGGRRRVGHFINVGGKSLYSATLILTNVHERGIFSLSCRRLPLGSGRKRIYGRLGRSLLQHVRERVLAGMQNGCGVSARTHHYLVGTIQLVVDYAIHCQELGHLSEDSRGGISEVANGVRRRHFATVLT